MSDSQKEELSTKQKLLNTAKEIFLECGYQAAPMRKIASVSGFTPGALYGYFKSKEDLFYALTDSLAEELMTVLNDVQKEMNHLPQQTRLFKMGNVYYAKIPKIADILLADRDTVKLIVNCSKGTKYENFLDNIAKKNTLNIHEASKNIFSPIQLQTLDILMEGYIQTLFRLVLSDKDRDTIIQCMKMIGKIYESGIITLIQKGEL